MFGFGSAIRDLSEAALRGELRACKGREEECDMVVQSFSWMYRKNVLVAGGRSVGKTTFVHGVVAAATDSANREDFEARLFLGLNAAVLRGRTVRINEATMALVDSLRENPRRILIVDGIAPVLSAKPDPKDPASLLGTAIKKGEISCIGTLTTRELEETLQAEPHTDHLFKIVRLRPFSRENTLALLSEMGPDLEREYNLRISDNALQKSVLLSQEYLPDLELPGKAVMTLRRAIENCSRRLHSPRDEASMEIDSSMHPFGDEVGSYDVKSALTGLASVDVFAAEDRKWQTMLAGRIKRRVFGQDASVEQTVAALVRIRSGFAQSDCPAGVAVFGGPPGVGKGHMAITIAQALMGGAENIIELNLAEYTGRDSVQRVFSKIQAHKTTVGGKGDSSALRFVLLRDMGKADPAVLGPLLRMFTHGCIRQQGCARDHLQKCLFIFTFNCDPSSLGGSPGPEWLSQMLASCIRKDLVEQIDAIVPFGPLDFTSQSAIMRSAMTGVYVAANERRIRIALGEEAFRTVSREGYTKEQGAKGLLQALHRLVIAPVTEIVESGQPPEGGHIEVAVRAGKIAVHARSSHDSPSAEQA